METDLRCWRVVTSSLLLTVLRLTILLLLAILLLSILLLAVLLLSVLLLTVLLLLLLGVSSSVSSPVRQCDPCSIARPVRR